MFRNNNPDKGTETYSTSYYSYFLPRFRNNNPDKGTETLSLFNISNSSFVV